MGTIHVPSARTAAKLKRLLGALSDRAPESGGAQPARGLSLVRCTSADAAGSDGADAQCYPAVVVVNGAGDEEAADGDLGAVWLTLWGVDGEPAVPVAGQYYLATLAGYLDVAGTSRQRAFAPAGAGVAFETSSLGSDFDLTAVSNSFEDVTGVSLSIPAAGDYELTAQARGTMTPGALGGASHHMQIRIHDSVTNAMVPDAMAYVVTAQVASIQHTGSGMIAVPVTFDAERTIKLQAARFFGTAPSLSRLLTSGTHLSYKRLG